MKNIEKFQTAAERAKAFSAFCDIRTCDKCEMKELPEEYPVDCCLAFWLELEAEEEKSLPCPFCGGKTYCSGQAVQCENEDYIYTNVYGYKTANELIAAHNRVAKAAMGSKKEVVKND